MSTFATLISSNDTFGFLGLFFAFAIGHAIADFALQGTFLSQAKRRGADLSNFFDGSLPKGVWFHALTAHCLIHAGAVWLISGSIILGTAELVLHWVIDFIKGEEKISFATDQTLHYLCKALYVLALWLWL